MAKKTEKKNTKKKVIGPTTLELQLEISILRSRVDRMVNAISKSKSVKGI